MTPDPHGSGAYIDPADSALAAALGIPSSLLSQVRGPLIFDTFAGEETASRSEKQYLSTIVAVGSDAGLAPLSGDTVSRGLRQVSVTANPAAAAGVARRQAVSAFGPNCFSAARPTIYARRFRSDSAKPTATDYTTLAGILRQTAADSDVVANGVMTIFDPTLGVDAWVVRAVRAGVAIQTPPIGAFDALFHTIGYLHKGASLTPFFDGITFPDLAGPELQPAAVVEPFAVKVVQPAASAIAIALETYDWVLWGT